MGHTLKSAALLWGVRYLALDSPGPLSIRLGPTLVLTNSS
jgi:hypothetical protein